MCQILTPVKDKYEGMFSHCWELQALDVTKFDTSKVTDMSDMFYGCKELQTLDVSNFDTSQVIYMSDMFGECRITNIRCVEF